MNDSAKKYSDDLANSIRSKKKQLRQQCDYKKAYQQMSARLSERINEIQRLGSKAVIDIDFADVQQANITDTTRDAIRKAGCCVVRGVFPTAQMNQWNQEISAYLADNRYIEKSVDKAGLDNYFSDLASSKPQIYSVYWSKPQIHIRQDRALETTRLFLNSLWHNPTQEVDLTDGYLYADRVRQRAPGDDTLGLSPHVDGGSVERWLDDGFHQVYQAIFNGNLEAYRPFDIAHRTETYEVPSPAVCRMFRTYQGWSALTDQGPGDGTLQIVPTSQSMGYHAVACFAR